MAEYRFTGQGTIGTGLGNITNIEGIRTRLFSYLAGQGLVATFIYIYNTETGASNIYTFNFHIVSSESFEDVKIKAHIALHRIFAGLLSYDGFVFSNSNTTVINTNTQTGQGSGIITYIVKAGDTLSKIATAYRTTVQKIATLNRIADVNRISVGQQLLIDVGSGTVTPTNPIPVVNSNQAQTVISQNQNNTGQNLPVVDTNNNSSNPNALSSVAQKLGISVSVLAIGAVLIFIAVSKD